MKWRLLFPFLALHSVSLCSNLKPFAEIYFAPCAQKLHRTPFNVLLSWMSRSCPLSLLHFSVFLRYRLADLSGDPLLRPLQHSDCIQQGRAKLPQAAAGCRRLLALLLDLDSAPSAGLEQLWHRRRRNQLLCVLDGSDCPVSRLHHLPLHFLPGYTCPGDVLLLWKAVTGSQTGREISKCVCIGACVPVIIIVFSRLVKCSLLAWMVTRIDCALFFTKHPLRAKTFPKCTVNQQCNKKGTSNNQCNHLWSGRAGGAHYCSKTQSHQSIHPFSATYLGLAVDWSLVSTKQSRSV